MHVFEYGKKSNMNELSPDQQRFTAKMIVKEVQRIAKEHNQVIAKLARLVRNLERKQGRIRAEHEFWNEKWITGHFRRTLISYGLYEVVSPKL